MMSTPIPYASEAAQGPPQASIVYFRKPDPAALIKMMYEWMHGDRIEQRETFEALKVGLDENRPEGFKLFP